MKISDILLERYAGKLKAILLVGGTGSGKSKIANDISGATGLRIVDPDKVTELLFMKHNLDLDFTVGELDSKMNMRNIAGDKTNKLLKHYMSNDVGIILDGTGRDYPRMRRTKRELMDLGYDVAAVFVDTDIDVALKRNSERRRKVDPAVAKDIHKNVRLNVDAYEYMMGDDFFKIKNNSPEDLTSPEYHTMINKVINWVRKPVRNAIGKSKIGEGFIAEGTTSVLYHSRSIASTISILTANKFKLTFSPADKREQGLSDRNKIYYLSTARAPHASYTYADADDGRVILVLDGRALGNNYRAKPIDYWKSVEDNNYEVSSEMEDRIFSNDPYIDNAIKYITGVHVYVPRHGENDINKDAYKIYSMSRKNNIPVYIYTNPTAWSKIITSKAVSDPLDFFKSANGVKGMHAPRNDSGKNYKEIFDPYIELYYKESKNRLTPNALELMWDILRFDSRTMNNDIFNDKLLRHFNRTPRTLDGIGKIFKKERITDPDKFIDMLYKKWIKKA